MEFLIYVVQSVKQRPYLPIITTTKIMWLNRTSACCTSDSGPFKRQWDCFWSSHYHSCTTPSVTTQSPRGQGWPVYSFVAANMNVTNICSTSLCTVMRLSPTSPTLTWLLHSRKTHVCSSGNFGTSSSIPLPKTYSITFLFLKGYLMSLWFHNRFFVALLKRQCAGGAAAHLQDVLVRLNFNGFYDLRGDSATV